MNAALWRALPTLAVFVIAACQPQAGAGPDGGGLAAATPSAGRAYAPQGTENATVVIRPEGDVIIAAVDGEPVMRGDNGTIITASPSGDEFDRLVVQPGSHMLSLSMLGAGGNMADVSVEADAGDYLFTVLEAKSGGQRARVLVVIQGGADGRIIASSTPALVGRSRTEAEHLLAASPDERRQLLAAEEPGGKESAERAKAYFNQGRQYLQQGQFDNAVKAFDGAIGETPEFAAAHVFRGVALMNLRRADDALKAFDTAIDIAAKASGANDEWLAWPYFEKGKALLAIGRLDDAEASLGRSIALKPTAASYAARANLYFVQGRAQRQQGKEDRAQALFEKTRRDADAGLALADDDVALWSIKSGAHFGLGDGKEACHAAEKACEFGNCSIVKQYKQCKDGS